MDAQIRGHDDGLVRQAEAVAGQGVGVDAVLLPAFPVYLPVDLQTPADHQAFQFNGGDRIPSDTKFHFSPSPYQSLRIRSRRDLP